MAAYDANLSELDSLSDSDWLDVASNKGVDTDDDGASVGTGTDPDSVGDADDRDEDQSPFNVDHWEGLNEEGPSHVPSPLPATSLSSPTSASAAALLLYRHNGLRTASSPLARNVLATEEDLVEDERVQSALDQSMVSTLSTSSSHSSTRASGELRLSFPDPLMSSRDTLMHSSYEDVHSSLSSDVEGDTTEADGALMSIPSTPSSDLGSPPTFEVPAPAPLPIKPIRQPVPGKNFKDHLRSPHVPAILAILSLALGYVMFGTGTSVSSQAMSTLSNSVRVASDVASLATTNKAISLTSTGIPAISSQESSVAVISIPAHSALAVVPKAQNALAPVVAHSGTHVATRSSENAVASSSRVPESNIAPVASTSSLHVPPSTTQALSVIPIPLNSVALTHTPAVPLLAKPDLKGKGKATARSTDSSLSAWVGSTFEAHLRVLGFKGVPELRRELSRALDSLTDALHRATGTDVRNAIQNSVEWAKRSMPHPPPCKHQRPIKEELRARRSRAKARARRLREGFAEHVKGRAQSAREKAHAARNRGHAAQKMGKA